MSNEQPVENLMRSTMENLKDMVDVNTVIGDAVETKDGTYIIPVSKLSFGFASGGSEYTPQKQATASSAFPFSGGSGAGVSVKPVAFLVVAHDGVRILPVDHDTTCDRIVDTVPQILDMVKGLLKDIRIKNNNCGNTTNVDSNADCTASTDNHNI